MVQAFIGLWPPSLELFVRISWPLSKIIGKLFKIKTYTP